MSRFRLSRGRVRLRIGRVRRIHGRCRCKFGRTWPRFGRTRPSSADIAPMLAQVSPSLVEHGSCLVKPTKRDRSGPLVCRTRPISKYAKFGQVRPKPDLNLIELGSLLVERRPTLGRSLRETSPKQAETRQYLSTQARFGQICPRFSGNRPTCRGSGLSWPRSAIVGRHRRIMVGVGSKLFDVRCVLSKSTTFG